MPFTDSLADAVRHAACQAATPPGFVYLPRTYMDNIIAAQELQIERKHFYIEFRENERGRFLRITEEAHGRRNTIIVPSTGLDEFSATLNEVLDVVTSAPSA